MYNKILWWVWYDIELVADTIHAFSGICKYIKTYISIVERGLCWSFYISIYGVEINVHSVKPSITTWTEKPMWERHGHGHGRTEPNIRNRGTLTCLSLSGTADIFTQQLKQFSSTREGQMFSIPQLFPKLNYKNGICNLNFNCT